MIFGMPTWLLGLIIVGGFCIWKFVAEPIMNEGQPIEPPEDYKTIAEQLEEATDINIDI